MEYFQMCLAVIIKEQKRFKLLDDTFATFTSALTSTFSENFDIGYNRCAYMYRYATCNICFMKDCIEKFLLDCSYAKEILSTLRSLPQRNLCSLSCGPGLDYLAFSMAILESNEGPLEFENVKIISKFGAWRNTASFVCDALQEVKLTSQPNFNNIDVIQGNVLDVFTDKMISTLKNSDVILMSKALNLTAIPVDSNEENFLFRKLVELLSYVKNGAILFFLDTKPSVQMMLKALANYSGAYLYMPGPLQYKCPMTFPDSFKEKFGVHPVLSARGTFFVWQNSCSYPLRKVPSMSLFEKMEFVTPETKMENASEPSSSNQLRFPSFGSSSSPLNEEKKVFDISGSLKNLVSNNSSPKGSTSSIVSSISGVSSTLDHAVSPEKLHYTMNYPSDEHSNNGKSSTRYFTHAFEDKNDSNDNDVAKLRNTESYSRSTVSQRLFSTLNLDQFSKSSVPISSTGNIGFSPQCVNMPTLSKPDDSVLSKSSNSVGLPPQYTGVPISSKADNIENGQIATVSIKKETNVNSNSPINKNGIPGPSFTCESTSTGRIKYSNEELKNIKMLSNLSNPTQSFDSRVPLKVDNSSSKMCGDFPKKETCNKKQEKVHANNDIFLKSFLEAKCDQTDPAIETRSGNSDNSISLLTDRIRKLVTSFEYEVADQNEFSKNPEAKLSGSQACHNQEIGGTNAFNNTCNGGVQSMCSSFHSNNHSDVGNKVLMDDKGSQKGHCFHSRDDCGQRCCMMSHCFRQRSQCCQEQHTSRCYQEQHTSRCCQEQHIPRCCQEQHIPNCYQDQHVPRCCQSSCRPSYMHSCFNASTPNIVIPFQNVSSDILSQILSLLQTGPQSG